jgi:hypothetical protein
MDPTHLLEIEDLVDLAIKILKKIKLDFNIFN